ncbi:MAG: pseudouridine synthase [Pseudomonadota bacterium]
MPAILFQDEHLLIVNKPAGLLSVPGRGVDKQDCLSARIQQLFADALVVHRLDMATSGLMVFARGEAMQHELSRMFREWKVSKRYVAPCQHRGYFVRWAKGRAVDVACDSSGIRSPCHFKGLVLRE